MAAAFRLLARAAVAGASLGLLLPAAPAGAGVVAPDPSSLLSGKRVLVGLPTDPTDWHPNARRIVTGKLRRIQAEAGIPVLDVASGLDTFSLAALERYDILFLNHYTTLEALEGRRFGPAFKAWLARGGKGWVGNHNTGALSAGEWPWFRDSVQSMRYIDHKEPSQRGTVRMTRDPALRALPVLAGLDTAFTGECEWYSFDLPPRAPAAPTWKDCRPLFHLDEGSVARLTDRMGADHAVAWIREDARGNRFFFTTLFHGEASADSDFYHSLLLRGLEYVAGYRMPAAARLGPPARGGGPEAVLRRASGGWRAYRGGPSHPWTWTLDGREENAWTPTGP